MTEHPITPPPTELVQQWREAPEFSALSPCVMVTVTTTKLQDIATQAAQWGADQELAACCRQLTDPEWYDGIKNLRGPFRAAELRAARRPKPPSLKEQALSLVEQHEDGWRPSPKDWDTIRRALEQLDD
jgi:hypothetical protein